MIDCFDLSVCMCIVFVLGFLVKVNLIVYTRITISNLILHYILILFDESDILYICVFNRGF